MFAGFQGEVFLTPDFLLPRHQKVCNRGVWLVWNLRIDLSQRVGATRGKSTLRTSYLGV